MVNLKKALAASALAVGLVVPAALAVSADEDGGSQTTTATCPTASQTFPFAIPGGLVPGVGTTGTVVDGQLVLSAESGQNGVCSGTFTAKVMTLAGLVQVAAGSFTAIHSGSTVTVFFHTTSGVAAQGVVYYNSATGHGVVATQVTSATGQCATVIAQFSGSPTTGFTITGTPIVLPFCFSSAGE